MKKIIRLSESELVSLVKRTIMEDNQSKNDNIWGCYTYPANSEAREWCECSKSRIKNKFNLIKVEMEKVKSFIAETNDLIGSIKKFSIEDEFFKYRVDQFNELKTLLKDCPKALQELEKEEKKFAEKVLFVYKKEQKEMYSLVNKLNTNYTALSYLLTRFRQKNNLLGVPFDDVFNLYFGRSRRKMEEGGESEFFNFLLRFFSNKEDEVNIMKQVFKIIEKTSEKGVQTENEAFRELVRIYGEDKVKNYAGDFSFVDMFGIDFMVYSTKLGKWVPVQVKTNPKDCENNSRVCENICMSKDNSNNWVYKHYKGGREI